MVNLKQLLSTKQAKVGDVLFIAVDGHGGSGKSTIANELANKLGAEIIHQDDFASWDNPLNWWPLVIERIFDPIAKGAATISYPRSKWWPSHNPEPVVNQPVTKVMVLEGVSSLRKEFRPYISLGIFVDTPREICFERGVKRDLEAGVKKVEVEKMWENWLKEEDMYMQRDNPKEYADITLDGTKPLADQLGF